MQKLFKSFTPIIPTRKLLLNTLYTQQIRFETTIHPSIQKYRQYFPIKKRLTHKQKKLKELELHNIENVKVEDIALNNIRDNPGAKKKVFFLMMHDSLRKIQ